MLFILQEPGRDGNELEVVAEPMKYREIEHGSTQSKHGKDKGQDQDHERNNGNNHVHALQNLGRSPCSQN